MALDRDLSVAVVATWARHRQRRLRAWEMLSATGVRGLRILHESGALAELVQSESHPEAFRWLTANAVGFSEVLPFQGDARAFAPPWPFDYVDLDPFGTPVPFVASAIEAVALDGLLGVTATDMPVLAGVQPAACEARYSARPLRGHFGPEAGLRILIAYLLREIAERGRSARPILGYVHDHHVRVYLAFEQTVDRREIGVLPDANWNGPELGEGPFGPMWRGPLLDAAFVRSLAVPTTAADPRGLRHLIGRFTDELVADVPFYFEPNRIAHAAGMREPPRLEPLLEELRRRGFAAGRTHMRPAGFRTTAPADEVIAAARAWRRLSSSPVR